MSDPSNSSSNTSAEEYQTAQTALVSSLCELSSAATQTATAALNFYKFSGSDNADAKAISASLKTLSEAVLAASKNGFSSVSNGRAIAKPVKRKQTAAQAAAAQAATTAAPVIPERIAGPVSSESSESAPSTADLDVLATTDPALLKASAPEKTRKKRAEKDPNAPKKPVTLYLRFNLAVREQLSKERKESGQPTLQATELNRIISERWATLPADAKLELQKAYEADYEVYKKDVEAYKLKKLAQETRAAEDAAGPVAVAVPVSSPASAPAQAPVVAPVLAPVEVAAPAPAAKAEVSAEEPAKATKEKPKKKKKSSKKASAAAATSSDVSDLAAVAAEVAKEAIAAEAAQAQPKPSKKRKEKEPGEKSSKKKKTQSEPQA